MAVDIAQKWSQVVRPGWRAGWGLVWPVECAGCGRPDVAICARCREAVAGPGFHTAPLGWPSGWGGWAACGYRGTPARLLIAWKERGRHDLGGPLGAGLAAAVTACRADWADRRVGRRPDGRCAEPWLLVPVPATAAARRARGADLVLDLARHAVRASAPAWSWPPPQPAPALRHVRRVRDQAALGAAARRANLSGALAVRPGSAALVAGRSCIVVDDIVTTGATAAEAARALTAGGARVVGVCSLSVTLRHGGVFQRPEQD